MFLLARLTDDVELDNVTLLRIRRDLALVFALVPCLDVFHLQRPSVRRVREDRLEPLVGDEHGPIHGEYVRVSSPDPRDLVNLFQLITRPYLLLIFIDSYLRA